MLAKALGGAPAKRALAMLESELAEPVRRSQPERLQPRRTLPSRIGKPAGGNAGRRDDPHQSTSFAQRQQAGRRSLHQLIVIEWTGGPRNSVEPLIGGAERARERRKIGLLGNGVGANQYAIRADAHRPCALLGGGQNPARQQVTNTVEFQTVARSARNRLVTAELTRAEVRQDRRRRDVGEPISHSGAANARDSNATDHHRCPPAATPSIVRLDFSLSPR